MPTNPLDLDALARANAERRGTLRLVRVSAMSAMLENAADTIDLLLARVRELEAVNGRLQNPSRTAS